MSNRQLTTSEEKEAGREAEEADQYLTFRLHDELYAFGILNVKEILEYGNVTQVPMMPDFIQGVINLRGEVVPVINLARRFGMESPPITKRSCVIIIEVENGDKQQDLGVMVDIVSEVLEIPASDMRATPGFGARIRTDFIRNMGKLGDDFVIILDENRVLSVNELAMVGDMSEGAPADSGESK
jgi:purine-binding chemotaxis protein CheW